MKLKIIFNLWLVLLALTSCSKAKSAVDIEPENNAGKFKVVGYMFAYGDLDVAAAKLDFDKITHLNVAFINPDETGKFTAPEGLVGVINRAHAKNVKVLFSLAGADAPAHLKELIKPVNMPNLVNNMADFVQLYNLDGIDVDLEGDFINQNYEAFIVALHAKLNPKNKLLTAAVATWNGNDISDKALALFDFINIMAYDHTGPWNKSIPGPHSSYEGAVKDYNYWFTNRKMLADKLVLGVPFYGHGFGNDIKDSYTYREIVATYPGAQLLDVFEVPQKGTIYYNGIPTIRRKVDFVNEKKAGGIMIWQLFGDADGEHSLLSVIHQTKK